MTTWWIICGTLLLAPFLVGPIFVYYKWRTSAFPDIVGVLPDHPQLPAQFEALTRQTLRALYPAGFRLGGAAILLDGALYPRLIALLENPSARDVALLTLVARVRGKGDRLKWKVLSRSLEFSCEYPNGARIITAQQGYIKGWPTDPRSSVLTLPTSCPVARLYEIHCALADYAGPKTVKCRLTEGRPLDYLRALHVKDVYARIRLRDLAFDEMTGVIHPTWRGAIRMAWNHLTPLHLLRMLVHQQWAFRLTRRAIRKPVWRPVPM